MYLGNLNIRSEWAEFVRKEEQVSQIICKYLRELYATDMGNIAQQKYAEIIGDREKNLLTEEEKYNKNKYIDDIVNEQLADFDSKMAPNNKFFRKQLFEALTKNTIPQEQKNDMIKLFEQRFLKVKDQNWTEWRKSAWGRRAATDTVSVVKILNKINKSKEKKDTKTFIVPDHVNFEDMQERIKGFYYEFFSEKNRKDRNGNFVITPERQAERSAKGLVNELEDAILDNSDARGWLVTCVVSELYNMIGDELSGVQITERSPGKHKEYDFHTEALFTYKHKEGFLNAVGFDMFFDSANCLKMNDDLFYNYSSYNHFLGIKWLKDNVDANIIPLKLTDNHIDGCIASLNDHTFLVNDKKLHAKVRDVLPKKYKDFTFLELDKSIKTEDEVTLPHLASQDGMSINVLSIDPKTVLCNKSDYHVCELLDKNGFNVVPVQLRYCRAFGGGIHCSTLDIERE